MKQPAKIPSRHPSWSYSGSRSHVWSALSKALRRPPSAALASIAAVLLVTLGLPDALGSEDTAKLPLPGVGIENHSGKALPLDVELTAHDGRRVRFGDVLGDRPAVLAFVYYRCPMLCSLVVDGLVKTLEKISLLAGEDFRVIAVSIDPEDSPATSSKKRLECLEKYGKSGGEAGWWFLTGDEANVSRLADAAGFRYRKNPRTGVYDHAAVVIVLTPSGTIARYHQGIDYSPRDLRLSLVDASEERIGTVFDQVLLLCVAWDPQKGKYAAVIWRTLGIAAGLTIVGLAALLVFVRPRQRRSFDGAEVDRSTDREER